MFTFPANPSLQLLPEGAVFLKKSSSLVVADLHLGKSAAFRARGLPIPEGDTDRDFLRLLKLVRQCNANHLIIAGDMFHAPTGMTPELEEALGNFIRAVKVPLSLVEGNHDRKIKQLPPEITLLPHLDMEKNIRIIHDPAAAVGQKLHLAGHWHPMAKISDGKRTSLRLPCFLFRSNSLILPAFGSFTGGATIDPQPGDRFFVGMRDTMVELPASLIF